MSYNLEQGSSLTFAQALTAAAHISGLTGAAATHANALLGYAIDGDSYTKAAASGVSTANAVTAGQGSVTPGATITIQSNQGRAIVWAVNAAGTTGVFAGPIAQTGDGRVGFAEGNPIPNVALELPRLPSGWAAVAVHTIQGLSNLSGTFTLGTSNWNVAGLTLGTGLARGSVLAGGAARSVAQLPNAALIAA